MAEKEGVDEDQLREELAAKPQNTSLNYRLMKALVEKGRKEEGLVYGLRALQRGTPRPAIVNDVLGLCGDLKLSWLSQRVAEAALGAGLTDERLFAHLARAKMVDKDVDGALRTLDEGERHNPNSRVLAAVREKLAERRPRAS